MHGNSSWCDARQAGTKLFYSGQNPISFRSNASSMRPVHPVQEYIVNSRTVHRVGLRGCSFFDSRSQINKFANFNRLILNDKQIKVMLVDKRINKEDPSIYEIRRIRQGEV